MRSKPPAINALAGQVRPKAANAAEMADCDFTTVLMTYATEYAKQANIEYFEQTGGTLLIGQPLSRVGRRSWT